MQGRRDQGEEVQMLEHVGKDFGESFFVIVRNMGNAHVVKINFVLLVKQAALPTEF